LGELENGNPAEYLGGIMKELGSKLNRGLKDQEVLEFFNANDICNVL
jgi:hypothetical protein